MQKPQVGQHVGVIGKSAEDMGISEGKVLAVFDDLGHWPGDYGEDRMGLLEYLDEEPEVAMKARWYAVVEWEPSSTTAFASPELTERPYEQNGN